MWRKEVRLEYWLNKSRVSPGGLQQSKKSKKSQGKVWPWGFNHGVREYSLDLHSNARNLDDSLPVPASVEDGLGGIDPCRDRDNGQIPAAEDMSGVIHEISLINTTHVHSLRLLNKSNSRTKQALMTIIPYCRRMQLSIGPVPVRSPETVHFHPLLIGGNGGLIPEPSVLSLAQEGSALPIYQTGVDTKTIPKSEFLGCIQEAKQAKGISAEQCELITIFRHIPIEMISKLHFIEEKKEIVYSLSPGLNRSSTRVYDLIVIRDISGKEIHLIPHRVRNRMVSLN